ncbi:hypothetical protein J2Z60_001544 [Lactobacillus colini]|uniref:Uncharacterized protein n=1 Tax=Lactobacillus colini TaxID=1819254 RepID=A0ABS4MFA0_9LACO|nr:hypothetical protein [Lactobacillus colini]MBP2058365.1 hypothetical protein [Lactobacillus colini]
MGIINMPLSQLVIPNYANWYSDGWLWIVGYFLTFAIIIVGLTIKKLHDDDYLN